LKIWYFQFADAADIVLAPLPPPPPPPVKNTRHAAADSLRPAQTTSSDAPKKQRLQ